MKYRTHIAVAAAPVVAVSMAVAQPSVATDPAASSVHARPTSSSAATPAQLRTLVPEADDAAGLSSRLVMWWQEGTIWHVALSTSSPAAASALKTALGPNTVVTTHAPIRTAIKSTPLPKNTRRVHVTVRKNASGHAVRPLITNPPPPGTQTYPNRLLDGPLYSGGDRIFRTYTRYDGKPYETECTAATLTNIGMLSAGHCDGGVANDIWQQGYLANDGYLYTTGTYGTTSKSVFAAKKTDASVIKASASGFNKSIYLDTQFVVPSRSATDHGSGTVAVGTRVCSDGSYSDLKCGGTVIKTNICINAGGETNNGKPITVNECGIDEATASSPIVQFGDSGGAVLAGTSISSTATTLGIISAEGGTTNPSKDLFFSDIKSVNSTLGTTEVSG